MNTQDTKRKIKNIHPAVREDIEKLRTQRALPTRNINLIDPFLFLNHHGPQVYPTQNSGLPFGPHPHRGFETVTFILDGDIAHRDSKGHESVIGPGGIQWMTAGRGIVHEELSSSEFLSKGGPLEILQLWINLPSRLKMTNPAYTGLQRKDIPALEAGEGSATIQLISGNWNGHHGPIHSLTDVSVQTLDMKPQSELRIEIAAERNIFFYVVRGEVEVNGASVSSFHLVEFGNEGTQVNICALAPSYILLCHAIPFHEPIASYGPFVMNTEDEIRQAIRDFRDGRF